MTRWEYCQLTEHEDEQEHCILYFYGVPTGQRFVLKRDARNQAIAQLGLDGWELVSIEEKTLFFKRSS